jgi:site-specific DNA recombinase
LADVSKKLLDLMLDDEIAVNEGKAEMKALDSRRKELEAHLKSAEEPPPLLQPSMADLYRSRVEELSAALQREETRLEASEKCVQRSIEIRGLRWNFRPPRR